MYSITVWSDFFFLARCSPNISLAFRVPIDLLSCLHSRSSVLHQLDQKIIYPHYDFKHLTEKYFEIGMKLDDFLIQLVKYWS